MKLNYWLLLVFVFLTLVSCNKENESKIYNVNGHAQKGPFVTGSEVEILELSETLQPTGKSFKSTVSDNFGSFSIPNVEFESKYVELIAEGYYYSEYLGYVGNTGTIVLKAIADLENSSTVNINILTHLSNERIKYLVQEENLSFNEALNQAQEEILKVFNLQDELVANYTSMDISQSGILNSKLLAITCIILGNRNVSDLSEFLAEFSFDLKNDGIIDSEEILSQLATSAVLCNTGVIRKNLSLLYNNNTVYNDFQQYVNQFRDFSTSHSVISNNTLFPPTTDYGINLLNLPDQAILDTANDYCVSYNIDFLSMGFEISIAEISNTDNLDIEFLENLNNQCWQTDSILISVNDYPALSIYNYCQLNNTGINVPMKIKLKDTGELLIKIVIISEELLHNNPEFVIYKYMSW